MTIRILDPTNERAAAIAQRAARMPSLAGRTVGIISNGKEGTKGYFAHLAEMLKREHGAADVVLRVKSNYSAPADAPIADEVRQWHAVVTGIGD